MWPLGTPWGSHGCAGAGFFDENGSKNQKIVEMDPYSSILGFAMVNRRKKPLPIQWDTSRAPKRPKLGPPGPPMGPYGPHGAQGGPMGPRGYMAVSILYLRSQRLLNGPPRHFLSPTLPFGYIFFFFFGGPGAPHGLFPGPIWTYLTMHLFQRK